MAEGRLPETSGVDASEGGAVDSRETRESLERECRRFARYLTGQLPTDYVVERYRHAHRVGTLPAECHGFDRLLVRFARSHTLATRMADGYARWFAPRSVLRDKLVLVLALLESCAPSHHRLDGVAPGGRAGTLVALASHGALSLVCLLLGVVALTPLRMFAARRREGD